MSNADKGKAERLFVATYKHGGYDWSLRFYAVDETDAKWKVENIKNSLCYDGEVLSEVRLPWFKFGILSRR